MPRIMDEHRYWRTTTEFELSCCIEWVCTSEKEHSVTDLLAKTSGSTRRAGTHYDCTLASTSQSPLALGMPIYTQVLSRYARTHEYSGDPLLAGPRERRCTATRAVARLTWSSLKGTRSAFRVEAAESTLQFSETSAVRKIRLFFP